MKNKINVVHYLFKFLPSSQSWIYNQMAFTPEVNHSIVTKRLENTNIFADPGPMYVLYQQPWYNILYQKYKYKKLQYFPLCLKAIDEQQADIFHSHSGEYGIRESNIKKVRDIAHIVSFYGADIWLHEKDESWQKQYNQLFHTSDRFLVEGNAMRNKVIELGCPEEKVTVQHLGVDIETIRYSPRTVKEDGLIRILVAGRSVDKKGHVDAVKTFAKIAPKYKNLRLVLMIGGSPDQCVRNVEEINQIIAENNLEDQVEWVGLVPFDEYLRQIYNCHILLSPSKRAADGDAEGGAPVVFTELSASGMPIISTTHCDIPEVILHEKSGLLSAEGDIDKLAQMLEYMVEHPELWEAYGKTGRAHIEQEYSASIQGRKLIKHYSDFI